jgi:hypothetical protein
MNKTLLTAALAAALFPLAAQAQSGEAFIEKSKIIGGGSVIHLYGLPTKDSLGKTHYFDTTLTLDINPTNGKPTNNVGVEAVKSPPIRSAEFVQGVYATGNATCDLVPSSFSGRVEFDLQCTDGGSHFTATWFTGLIAGHPYEQELKDAGLNTLPGNENYAWGKVGLAQNFSWFGCFDASELFAARQVGDFLTLTNYGHDSVVDCQITLNKQP